MLTLTACGKQSTSEKDSSKQSQADVSAVNNKKASSTEKSSESSSKTNQTSTASTKTSSSTSATKSAAKVTTLWDSDKQSQLKNKIQELAQSDTASDTNGQSYTYTVYDENNQYTNDLGTFPQDFPNKTFTLNSAITTLAWSTDGTGSAEYNVVAVVGEAVKNAAGMQASGGSTMFFAFKDGQPVVLSMQIGSVILDTSTVDLTADTGSDKSVAFSEIAGVAASSAVAPITETEADTLAKTAGVQVYYPWLTTEGSEHGNITGGAYIAGDDGSMTIRWYATSAHANLDTVKLTPNTDGTVHVVWDEASLETADGQPSESSIIKDTVIPR